MSNYPRILVVGDAMVDVYHIGDAVKLSPEAPIPVVKISETKRVPGGAGNVAACVEALTGAVDLIACGNFPRKHRLLVGDMQLARWDEHDRCDRIERRRLFGHSADAIIISDYDKGAIDQHVINYLRDLNLPTFIDCKSLTYYTRFYGSATFFPNRAEYNAEYFKCANVVKKSGPAGMTLFNHHIPVHSVPALARHVRSVIGAGDAVIAAYAYASLMGEPDPLAFAAAAAAVAVEHPYTYTPTLHEVTECLTKSQAKIEKSLQNSGA